VRTRTTVEVADLRAAGEELAFGREIAEREGTRSVLALPLVAHGRLVGAMNLVPVDRGAVHRFRASERRVAQAFADLCAVAIENARRGEAVRASEEQARFLAEASAVLAASLDPTSTLDQIAHLAVPTLADWCTVYTTSESGEIRRTAVAFVDPDKVPLVEALRGYAPSPTAPQSTVARVLSTGEPELVTEIPDEYVQSIAQDAEHLRILNELGFRSSMVVPLRARGRVLGALSLFMGESGRRFGRDDLALATELALRAGLAIDNGRLHVELQEALAARDRVLAAVSHDLVGPLTAVRAAAQLLRQRLRTPGAPTDELVGRIDGAARRATDMVGDLVDVARLEAGHSLDLTLRTVDLVGLARASVEEHRRMAPGREIEVETALPSLIGRWDRRRLERVLDNLLGNALKYSPDDTLVSVAIDQEEDAAGQGWARLAVRDRGLGISAADRPKVFEPYHRGANVAARISGTGIGLASARQIVEQHGGEIVLESAEHAGSVFTMRLPLVAPSAQGDLR
jgi:signal transduction histidine kinase